MTKTAFIGLGVMGAPMAGHLQAAGRDLTVANRTPVRARTWAEAVGGRFADLPVDAARDADVIITMVRNDDDLAELVLGPGGVASVLQPGSILIDHTTASPGMARFLGTTLGERGIRFADAPVSGGQSGAEAGRLSVMIGCAPEDEADVAEAVLPYAANVRRIGSAGAGQASKLVNQVCVAGVIQGLAEGLALGERIGLDMEAVLQAIQLGAAQSWQMDHRARTMLTREFDFGFSVDLLHKDLVLALRAAREVELEIPVTVEVSRFLGELQRAGKGAKDNSSLITRLVGDRPALT